MRDFGERPGMEPEYEGVMGSQCSVQCAALHCSEVGKKSVVQLVVVTVSTVQSLKSTKGLYISL